MNVIESFVSYILEFIIWSLAAMCKVLLGAVIVTWTYAYYNW